MALNTLRLRTRLVIGYTRFQSTARSTAAVERTYEPESVKPFHEVPGPSGTDNLPFIGMGLIMKKAQKTMEELHLVFDELHNKHGDIIRLRLGSGYSVITCNPIDIEKIYKNEGKYPRRESLMILNHYYTKSKKEKGLVFLDGEEWHQFRQQIQKKLVRPNAALYYIKSQALVARDLVDKLKTTKPEETRDLLFSYASESIGVVCFNKRLGLLQADRSPEIEQYLQDINEFFILLNQEMFKFPLYKYIETDSYKQLISKLESTIGFGRKQVLGELDNIMDMKKQGKLHAVEPNFLMSILAEEKLTLEQCISIVVDLLTAGNDSTAKALEILLDTLARHPDVQEKMLEEIKHFIGEDGDPTEETLPQMKYIHSCVKESMRLNFPIVCGNVRVLPEDIVLSGYHIPKETRILLNNRRLVLNEQYAPEPHRFLPERWMRDDSGKKNVYNNMPTVGMLPFGLGVRNCIGRRFAEQELYLAVAKVVQKFRIGLVNPDVKSKVVYQTFRTFKDPPLLTFTPRS